MKFEDFRKFGPDWPFGLWRPFRSTQFYETSMGDRRRVGDINLWKFQNDQLSGLGWRRADRQTNKQRKSNKETRRRRAERDTCKIQKINLTSKIIGGWIQWPNKQLLFKSQVNRMKIDNFRNPADVFLADFDLKNIIGGFNSVTWNINPIQISSQSDENWGF